MFGTFLHKFDVAAIISAVGIVNAVKLKPGMIFFIIFVQTE